MNKTKLMTIRVNHITIQSFRALQALGYLVIVVAKKGVV